MAEANSLTAEVALSHLCYDPETGEFRWLASGKGRPGKGEVAGVINPVLGYRMIGLLSRRYYAHRLAWLVTHGEWPAHQIDHINGDRADNRISNLRAATHADNQLNRHNSRPNKHGFRGVDQCPKTGRYRAAVKVRGVRHALGYFDTPEAAHNAYLDGVKRLNPMRAGAA